MTQHFDADAFMNSVTDEFGPTSIPITPIGQYTGTISKVEFKSGTIANGEKAGDPWYNLNLAIETSDPEALVGTTMTKRTVFGGIMLETNEDGTPNLAKTVKVNQLREAVGLGKGVSFAPNMLVGRSLRFEVGHRPHKTDPEKLFEDFKSFKAL